MIEQALASLCLHPKENKPLTDHRRKMNYDQVPVAESLRVTRRLLLVLLIAALVVLAITLLAGFLAPAGSQARHRFAFSWLFAFLYFFTILIGCFFWIIVHHSTDSGWGILVRRQMENLVALIPYMAIFFHSVVFAADRDLELDQREKPSPDGSAIEGQVGLFRVSNWSHNNPFFLDQGDNLQP